MKPLLTIFRKCLVPFCVLGLAQPLWAQQDHAGHGQGDGNGQGHTMTQRAEESQGAAGMNHGDGMQRAGQDGMSMGDGMMMEHMQQMHSNMHRAESNSGQSAFDLIKEVVDQLEANPNTDWAQVNIAALRQHLMDMNRVTLYAEVAATDIDGGARFAVTGDRETRDAIRRMVPDHAAQIQQEIGWNTEVEEIRGGLSLIVSSDDPAQVAKIRGLGFMGFMVQGNHHAAHHVLMAGGQPSSDEMMANGTGHSMGHGEDQQGSAHGSH